MTLKKFLAELSSIFEVSKIDPKKKITSLKNWDSLTQLSVIALINSNFNKVKIDSSKIRKFQSIEKLHDHLSKK